MIPVHIPPPPVPASEKNKPFDYKMVRPSSSSGRRHLGHFDNTESMNSKGKSKSSVIK
jgi:hypothetical protein